MQPEELPPLLSELIEAARREEWNDVDDKLPLLDPEAGFLWATDRGIRDANPQVRDLAVSILGTDFGGTLKPFSPGFQETLLRVMEEDENPFVRYRTAFALWKRGITSESVRRTMEEAANNPDVSEIAKGLLFS